MKEIIDIIKRNHLKILIYSIIAFVLFVIFGLMFFPNLFYDNWIWKYYWGPIVADATPNSTTAVFNGVAAKEGYTIVSEITYGIILVISIYLIYKLLKKLKIAVNWRFALALLPYIIFGPVIRVLEDSGYFESPLVYFFISPLIYVVIAFFALFFLILGYFLKEKYKKHNFSVNKILFIGGVIFLLPSLALVSSWILGFQWGPSSGVHFDVFVIVIGVISLLTFFVYYLTRFFNDKKDLSPYQNPLNLSMLFGHLMDGVATYISIKDPFMMGLYYSEKHPASNFLLDIWGPLFPIVKFLLIIVVIYVFDILYKDELKEYVNLVNLLKIGILILGFSPGLRNLLRVTMGV